jgi:anti-sigma B factor antagonist
MTFQRTDQGDSTTLRVEGTLDAVTAPELRPVLESLVAERRKTIVIDLAALRLIDSSGVGAIVALFKRVRATGGEVKVTGLRDQPLAIFRLLRIDRILAS